MPTVYDPAYLAGYFDSEGSVGISYSGAWSCYVQFKQTQPDALVSLVTRFGGNWHLVQPKRGRRYVCFRLSAFDAVQQFLRDVRPFVREKQPQVDLVLVQYNPRAGSRANRRLKAQLEALLTPPPIDPKVFKKRLAIAPKSTKRCSASECPKKAFARGRCKVHYNAARLRGEFVARERAQGVPFIRGRTLTEEERRYIAGYFDGDGCVLIRHRKYGWDLKVHFGQSHLDALKLIREVYGGSLCPRKVKAGVKPIVDFQIVQREASRTFCEDVAEFVREKRPQVDDVLREYDPRLSKEDGKELQRRLSKMKKREYTGAEFRTLFAAVEDRTLVDD